MCELISHGPHSASSAIRRKWIRFCYFECAARSFVFLTVVQVQNFFLLTDPLTGKIDDKEVAQMRGFVPIFPDCLASAGPIS